MGLSTLLFAFAALVFLVLWLSALRRARIAQEESGTADAPDASQEPQRGNSQVGGLFAQVGDRVHEVVLLHSDVILYATPQFAPLLGVARMQVGGRALPELVPADQLELV